MESKQNRFIGMAEVCQLANRSYMTIDRWIAAGKFPPYEVVGRSKVWLRSEVYDALRLRGVTIDE